MNTGSKKITVLILYFCIISYYRDEIRNKIGVYGFLLLFLLAGKPVRFLLEEEVL